MILNFFYILSIIIPVFQYELTREELGLTDPDCYEKISEI